MDLGRGGSFGVVVYRRNGIRDLRTRRFAAFFTGNLQLVSNRCQSFDLSAAPTVAHVPAFIASTGEAISESDIASVADVLKYVACFFNVALFVD